MAALFLAAAISSAQAQNTNPKKPIIVLVHGAYADGSSWSKVIPMLQSRGYTVISVQNPLSSLADDVAATNRVINQQTEPVLLVGHSWAGVVITQAGNNPKVKALVYVSALAPESGQSLVDAAAGFPPSPAAGSEIKDEAGFLTLPASSISKYFAPDLTPAEQGVVAATQGPWYIGCLTDKVTKAAWREKPSWWVIGENDHMVNPKLQEKMAANIKAKLTKLPTGHLAMLADPKAVTDVILDAASSLGSMKASNELTPNNDAGIVGVSYNPPAVISQVSKLQERISKTLTVREILGPPAVLPLSGEQPPAKIFVDPPVPEALARGLVIIQYRTENLRIAPVYGPSALDVSPRIGHIHITVDDGPWRWLDASGDPVNVNKLPPGPHKILIELVNANHQTLDRAIVNFVVPNLQIAKCDSIYNE
jgi:pimeloyl-ACP methyl ester carboxylesterase